MKKTAPPLVPVTYGKRQIFPKPIADPAAAKIKPKFEVQFSLFFILYLLV
jgi:hypothetical protein